MTDIIVSCTISQMPRPMPEGMFDLMPQVTVTTTSGETITLFSYYPDELTFCPAEFIGLTVAEGHDLKRRKDIYFLQH